MQTNEFKTSLRALNIDFDSIAEMRSLLSVVESISEQERLSKVSALDSGISVYSVGTEDDLKSVAILEVKGALLYSAPEWYEMFGLTAYNLLSKRLNTLLKDPSVKTIVMRIQSPGGTAFGASEMSEAIFKARNEKRIIAYADPYAFSAAYEIGSAASEFYTTKTGMVGSVGSYTMHIDYSQMLEKEGYKVTFIKAGEKKTDGNSYEPLSDSAKKDIQAEVDFFYREFVRDVARNRNVTEDFVEQNFGQGGRVLANEALSANMIDGIISFDALLNRELTALTNESNLVNRPTVNSKAFAIKALEILELGELTE